MSAFNVQSYAHAMKEIEIDLPDLPDLPSMSKFAHGFTWAVFVCMLLGALSLLIMSAMRPVGTRAFHQLSATLCLTATVAYFCMASGIGSTLITQEIVKKHAGTVIRSRQVWFARYIDWTITTPLLLLDLLLATGLPLSDIYTVIFVDIFMIVTGLIGSLVADYAKWGLFAMGCAAQLYIWYVLLLTARPSAARLGEDFGKSYTSSAIILSVLWLFYPIVWGLADGSGRISPSAEMVTYGVLDVLAKPVFCILHCISIGKCDYARLELTSGKYSEGATVAALADQ